MQTQRRRRPRRGRRIAILAAAAIAISVAGWIGWRASTDRPPWLFGIRRVAVEAGAPSQIVRAAHMQEGDAYDASYRRIPYPSGDVPAGAGACTDVVIRALRAAGYDLQRLVHEDVAEAPEAYGIGRPDANIDHRRVLNLMVFFGRHGEALPTEYGPSTRESWRPGDVVCWRLGPRQTHIGVISDGISADGRPLAIHNAGRAVEADVLQDWPIIGHYRYPPR